MATVKLNDGNVMPLFGLGTWLSEPGEVGKSVEIALKNGYKLIDCAHVYQNQQEIGASLKKVFAEGNVKREDVFITSKVWNTSHPYELALKCVDQCLADLGVDYLDLCLVHWPMAYKEGGDLFPKNPENPEKIAYSDADYLDTWKALEAKVKEGKIRSIGVSNFAIRQIQRVIDNGEIKPAVLQIELHPYLQEKELVAYCKSQSIAVTSYSSLGNLSLRKPGELNVLSEPVLAEIAKAHGKSIAQVVLRALNQKGIAVIPKSVNEGRIIENANINDFSLTAEELEKFEALDKNHRFLDLKARDGDHPHFPW